MSDDINPRLAGLISDFSKLGLILARMLGALPLPIAIMTGVDDDIALIDVTDVIIAAQVVKEMPGIPAALAEAMYQASWFWVSAGHMLSLHQEAKTDSTAWSAMFLMGRLGEALSDAKTEMEGME